MSEITRKVLIPLGVVVRRTPGVTRWVRHAWKPVAVLPDAPPADWRLLREDGEAREYHDATVTLELHRAEAEAYQVSLAMTPASVYVVLRASDSREAPHEVQVHSVTASACKAQDYLDSGEEIVEAVPMPEGLEAWVRDFVDRHYEETTFVKRRRDRKRVDLSDDGIGDARIRQAADVYRAPAAMKSKARPH